MYLNKEQSEIKRWWEYPRNRRWNDLFDNNDSTSIRLNSRAKKVIHYLVSLTTKNETKVLELGFGAGQLAKIILEKNYLYEGLDISSQLKECAEERCLDFVKEGRAKFQVASIDERFDFNDSTFDFVIAVGVFQYATNVSGSLKEINRVLKKSGHLIVCQTNMYDIQRMIKPRHFFLKCIYAFLREKYEIAPSFKAMALNSKMKFFFNRFKNAKFFRLKVITKGHVVNKYEFKKRLFSTQRLSNLLKKYSFEVLYFDGAPYFYSETRKYSSLANIFDKIFMVLGNKKIIPFLSRFADNVIIIARNKNDVS